jgi:hypothetical protein
MPLLCLDMNAYPLLCCIFLLHRIGGLVVEQSAYGGLGLTVTQAVPANTVVMAVPSKVALSVESPGGGPDDQGPYSLLTDRKVMRDSPWFAQFSLYLYTLDNISSKRGSIDMRPWLESLPRYFDTPIHWSQSAMDALQYPHLCDAVSRHENDMERLCLGL